MARYSYSYTVTSPSESPRTVVVHIEQTSTVTGDVVDWETHSITMSRDGSTALLRVESANGASAHAEMQLDPSSVVCVDFLPRVFGAFQALYAIGTDRVAVLMQPYARIDTWDRPLVRFDGGVFEDVVCCRGLPVQGLDDEPSLDAFHATLGRLFDAGKWVRTGEDMLLPAREDAEADY